MRSQQSMREHLDELDEVEARIGAARSRQRRARRHWFVEAPLLALILCLSNDARAVVAGVGAMAAIAFAVYVVGSMDLDAWRFRRDCLVENRMARSRRRSHS